jgi:hypothetical protein
MHTQSPVVVAAGTAAGADAAVASTEDDDAAVQPDFVTSTNNNTTEDFTFLFDEEEYQYLRKRYLQKRVHTHVALPHSGMRLRRQTKRAASECNSPGYRALSDIIQSLDRSKKNQEIYRLLKQLTEWETKQGRFPTFNTKSSEKENDEVVEVIDLSNEYEREEHVIDVDTFITEILLVKVKQEPWTADDQEDASEEGAFEGPIAPNPVVSDPAIEGGLAHNNGKPPRKDVLQPIMVEFKFCCWSEDTDCNLIGVLHIPLLQDLKSGLFSLTSGKLGIEGTLYPTTEYESTSNFDEVGDHFTGVITFGDHGEAMLVLDLTWSEGWHRFVRATGEHDWSKLCSETTNLHEWVRTAGGPIMFACQGKHHSKPILLYTFLSENQTGSNTLALPIVSASHAQPDWDRLESLLLKRNSAWDTDTAKKGIKEYKKFLERRITEDNLNSLRICITSSILVNTVWVAHLAFSGQYLQDVAAFAAEIGKDLPSSVNKQTTTPWQYLNVLNYEDKSN